MRKPSFTTCGKLCCSVLLACSSASAADRGSTADITVGSGPHAGKYTYRSDDACVIAALDRSKPLGFSIVLTSDKSSLSIDAPNADPKHVSELQIEVVIADVKPNQSRKNTSTTTYLVDTRPDASLEPYQRDERGGKGLTGRASATLQQQGSTANLKFSASTAQGVKIEGRVTCFTIDREYGR